MTAAILPFPVKPRPVAVDSMEGPGIKVFLSFEMDIEAFRCSVALLTGNEQGFSEPEVRREKNAEGVEQDCLWTEKRYPMEGLCLQPEILQKPGEWPDWFTAMWCKAEIIQCQETGQLKLSKWGMERLVEWGSWVVYTQGRIDVLTDIEFSENFKQEVPE